MVKENIPRTEVPVGDGWRVQYLAKLLAARKDMQTNCQNTDEITTLIESLCSS